MLDDKELIVDKVVLINKEPYLARYALFDQQFMPDTEGAVVDSGTMMGIIPGAQVNGKCVQLTGVTGHTTSAEVADVVYPILTIKKAICVCNSGHHLGVNR